MLSISKGNLLISDPFLKDPNFLRSVIFLCEHQEEGTVGFIINKLHDEPLENYIEASANLSFPLYYGGPVATNTLHFIHRCPNLISEGLEITDGIFWGGDFENILTLLNANALKTNEIKFFIGYSGWSEGQLEAEIETKSWITRQATNELIFDTTAEQIWKNALKEMDGEYKQMIHYPLDPQLN
jgi:putative transcriptional regulator